MGKNAKRPRGDALAAALVEDRRVVQEHAQWWSPPTKPQVGAVHSSAAEGVDGAVSAWVADECNRVMGQE